MEKRKKRSQWVFLCIGSGVVLLSFFLVFRSSFLDPSAPEILPTENLIFFSSIEEILCSEQQRHSFPQSCKKQENILESVLERDLHELSPFVDRISVALYRLSSVEQARHKVLMFHVSDNKKAEEYINTITSPDQKQKKGRISLFALSSPRSEFVFLWKGWLFFITEKDFVHKIISVHEDRTPALGTNTAFRTLSAQEQDSTANSIFLPGDHIQDLLSDHISALLSPLLLATKDVLMTAYRTENGFSLHTIVSHPSSFIPFTSSSSEPDSNLLSHISSENLVFVGQSFALAPRLMNVLSFLEQHDSAFALTITGRIQALLTETFGEEISFSEDIVPLFLQKTILTFSSDESGLTPLLITEVEDKERLPQTQKIILSALRTVAQKIIPRVQTHTLQDGTTIQEITGCKECVTESEQDYETHILSLFQSEDEMGAVEKFALAMSKNMLLFSSDEQKINSFFKKTGAKPSSSSLLQYIPHVRENEEFFVLRLGKQKNTIFHRVLQDIDVLVGRYFITDGMTNIILTGSKEDTVSSL